ncbi:hypothetical protein N7468_004505 [Penicillium chermesinum]|uniref:Uncharacterized protein n=1 Tax=Penicillium chermesinum TaxID=63820 RepID=A0A9W9TSM8_9EURO|nr:uncharacterized protein N7468_004505 [Penicillium chermesinum]KAJ5239886.1 hypothetical protein N7468_004505 [Penicillium chermesinum]
MARRQRKTVDPLPDDSDPESTEDGHYDTDFTEPEDEGSQDKDVSDAALLFADNEHPPEYYIQQLADFDETDYTKEDYGKGTQSGGRKVVAKVVAVFRLVYKRATSNKITKQMNGQMRRVIRRLAKKHKLSSKGRDKPAMDVEDLTKVVETTVSTTKKKFGHGRHRIELALFLQFAGLTTNRPQAILNLRHRHIQVSLLRDPQGGPHRIIIEFTFGFTKEWLGAKDADTYILPEIIFDPSLVLSEEVLVSACQIPQLRIPDGCNELPLHIDPALDDVPIFRMSERTMQGISISPDKPLPYTTIEPWVKKIGVITGFPQVTCPYSLRYGAGTALDSSGSVSDSLRNLIMHHADTRTFLRYYLSRRINKNLPVITCGLNPEDDIMRAACRISRSIDPNRPQELTTAQSSSVNQNPEIADLIRRRDELSRQMGRPLSNYYKTEQYTIYKKLNQEIAGARQRARNALLTQIQAKYDREQPMLEIRRQLSGFNLAEEEKPLKCSEAVPLPQKRLIESLLTLPRPTLEEEVAETDGNH